MSVVRCLSMYVISEWIMCTCPSETYSIALYLYLYSSGSMYVYVQTYTHTYVHTYISTYTCMHAQKNRRERMEFKGERGRVT